jgi:hypothetical protein
MRSPTARTLKYLRELGASVRIVEHWNAFANRRVDLWGADLQVIQGRKLLGIQNTSGAHHAAHVTAAKANSEVYAWLATGNLFEVWSWAKHGARGKRKLWDKSPRVTQLFINQHGKVSET